MIQEPDARGLAHPSAAFFWAGIAIGELRVLRCDACAQLIHPPRPVCRRCLGEHLTPYATAGTATVYSDTVERRLVHPTLGSPYRVAVLQLDEGPHMVSNLVGFDDRPSAIGDRVEVEFIDSVDGRVLPVFRPVSTRESR